MCDFYYYYYYYTNHIILEVDLKGNQNNGLLHLNNYNTILIC